MLQGGANAPVLMTGISSDTTAIRSAYAFNGTNAGRGNFAGQLPGRTENVTIELWAKPTDLSGQEILFEAGGDGNGFAILLDDNVLRLQFDQDSALPGNANLIAEASPLDPLFTMDFHQIVAEVDLDNDLVRLFLDGALVATAMSPGDLTAWAGGNADNLGGVDATGINIGGSDMGNLDAFGTFDGQIGIVRFYQNTLLTSEEVRANFAAVGTLVVPEPATIGLLALASAALLRRRRITC